MRTSSWLPLAVLICVFAVASACSSHDAEEPEATPAATGTTPSPVSPTAAPTPIPPTPNAPINSGQDVRNFPWNRDLQLYRSSDGVTFTGSTAFIERAGVPNIIRDSSGRLVAVFQWFPFDNRAAFDRVAVAFSSDNGATWTKPVQMTFAGLPETLMRPFDPTVVQLADGRYRLYFTSNERASQSRPAIYSAISADGVAYQFEPGARFAPEGGTVDCSVVFFDGVWHLFSHNQQANTGIGFHATSSDGLSFTRLADVNAGQGRQWIGNALVVDGKLRYFGSGREGIWIATSADGAAWTVTGKGPTGGDPSAVVLPGGQLLLAVVGEPRADAGPAPF